MLWSLWISMFCSFCWYCFARFSFLPSHYHFCSNNKLEYHFGKLCFFIKRLLCPIGWICTYSERISYTCLTQNSETEHKNDFQSHVCMVYTCMKVKKYWFILLYFLYPLENSNMKGMINILFFDIHVLQGWDFIQNA